MDVQKRNFIIIWICNFLVAGTMTMIMPFLSLYIETFGDHSPCVCSKMGWTYFWCNIRYRFSYVTNLG